MRLAGSSAHRREAQPELLVRRELRRRRVPRRVAGVRGQQEQRDQREQGEPQVGRRMISSA